MVSSDTIIGIAVSCRVTATACYLWGRSYKGKVDYFNGITRVIDLNRLDDLLKEKTTNLLVVVSGKVASAAPFNCKYKSPLSVVFEETAEVGFESKLEDGGLVKDSINILLQRKVTPWYLEDSTGRVNVVGAKYNPGIDDDETQNMFGEPLGKIFSSIVSPEKGSKVLYGNALSVGTPLTVVGEAVKDKTGNLMIQKPKWVFKERSFDQMVDKMKSNSEFYILLSEIFGTIAVAIAIKYGVDFMRKFVLPFVWKKKDNTQSDNEETDIN